MKRAIFLILLVSMSGHAGSCLQVQDEPVSVCRAKKACGGFGTALGMLFGGAASATTGTNAGVDRFNSCMSQNLEAQRANANYQLAMQPQVLNPPAPIQFQTYSAPAPTQQNCHTICRPMLYGATNCQTTCD